MSPYCHGIRRFQYFLAPYEQYEWLVLGAWSRCDQDVVAVELRRQSVVGGD